MRILFVSQYYLPQPLANAEVVGGIASGLAARGHEVHVVTPAGTTRMLDGVHVHRTIGTFAEARGSVPRRLVDYASFSIGALAGSLFVPRPDVMVVTSPPPTLGLVGLLAAALRRCPLVYVVQDLYPEVVVSTGAAREGAIVRMLARLMKLVYRRSAAVVVIDASFVDVIAQKVPSADVRAVRNGIDLAPFAGARRDETWLRSLGVDPAKPVVMYAGNVGRSQDLHAVVRCTASCSVQLLVHGGGSAMEPLREEAKRSEWDHVHFSGYVGREQLGTVFASADLHVVPLKPDISASSVPSKLLSIFAAGRPALVAAERSSPASRLVIETGAGWVAPAGDADALCAIMRDALGDRGELERRGALGRSWAKTEGGSERCAREYESILDEVLRNSIGHRRGEPVSTGHQDATP